MGQRTARGPGGHWSRRSPSERRLLERARRGSDSAVAVLFARYRSWLRSRARGRLPRRTRGTIDTRAGRVVEEG